MNKCECNSDSDKLQKAFLKGETDFLKCNNCGLFFREKFPSKDELELIYKNAYKSNNVLLGNTDQESPHFTLKAYSNYLYRKYASNLRKNINILDFGAGAGGLIAEMNNLGLEVDGFEYSNEARIEALSQRNIVLFENLTNIPDNYYDLICMIEVIEHLTKLQETLAGLKRAMKPGAKLFLTTPNRLGLRSLIEGGHWREAKKKFHLFLFDEKSIRFHLKMAGFSNVKRVVFGPVQNKGIVKYLYTRLTQFLYLSGSIYIEAEK